MSAILVFARPPIAGRTKTRLIPALGAEGAARLHRELVRHSLDQACAAGAGRVELWAGDVDSGGVLAALAARHGVRLHHQAGPDLGARMAAALADAVERGGPALVIGSDCPALDAPRLARALALLEDHAAVLGPARDGGYVLLGLHRVDAALFSDVPWGTAGVLEITRARLAALGWGWAELEALPDVDRPEDLEALRDRGRPWSDLVAAG